MSNLWTALSGYKTYLGALITVAYAGYQYFVAGDMPQAEAMKMIEGALFACTIRHGMATSIAQFIISLKDGAANAPSPPPQKAPQAIPPKTTGGFGLLLALGIGLLSLQACGAAPAAGTTVAQPQTPKETLVALETSFTAAIETADDLLAQHIITGHAVADVVAAASLGNAALDNADTLILAASEPTATQADQDNAAKALQVAQTAVASLLTILQKQQQPGSK